MTGYRTSKMIPAMSKDDLRAMLPNVGDIQYREPTIAGYGYTEERHLQRCVVVYVNVAHHWFEVRFDNGNIRESYKLPE